MDNVMNISRIVAIGSYCYFGSREYFREVVTSLIESAEKLNEQEIRDAANKIIQDYQQDINTPFGTGEYWDETTCDLVFIKENGYWVVGFSLDSIFHPISKIHPAIYAPDISRVHILDYYKDRNAADFFVYFPVNEEEKSAQEKRLHDLIKSCDEEISDYGIKDGEQCVEFLQFQLN